MQALSWSSIILQFYSLQFVSCPHVSSFESNQGKDLIVSEATNKSIAQDRRKI